MRKLKGIYQLMLQTPVTRLLIGLIKMGLSVSFFVTVHNGDTVPFLASIFKFFGFEYIGFVAGLDQFSFGLAVLSCFFLVIISFYYLCDGALNIFTWRIGPLSTFDSRYHWVGLNSYRSKTNGRSSGANNQYKNIGRVIEYRDSLMNHMGREEASSLYASTQNFVGNFGYNPRMMEYIDANLNHMSRDQGLDYIQSLNQSKEKD